MTHASGQEPREPLEEGEKGHLCLVFLCSTRGRSRGPGLRLDWKAQIRPKRGLCLEKV